jgi:hypothetical protein
VLRNSVARHEMKDPRMPTHCCRII